MTDNQTSPTDFDLYDCLVALGATIQPAKQIAQRLSSSDLRRLAETMGWNDVVDVTLTPEQAQAFWRQVAK